jgi:Na+/H+-dicarboxylate symporter
MMTVADANTIAVSEEEQAEIDERGGMAPHDVVVQVFESFIPSNVASAVANDELLAVLVSAVVVGCLIRGPDSSLLRAVREIEKIVMKIITFLIKLAPVGVFFLILSNLFKLGKFALAMSYDYHVQSLTTTRHCGYRPEPRRAHRCFPR